MYSWPSLAACRLSIPAASLFFVLSSSAGKQENIIPTEEFVLPNRLRVYLHEDHRQPFVAVHIRYNTGAAYEPPSQAGVNTLIDYLMWRWMGHLYPHAPWYYFAKSGSSYARSWRDMHEANYVVSVPAVNLETALWVESDRMAFLFPDSWRGSQRSVTDLAADALLRKQESTPYYSARNHSLKKLFSSWDPRYYGEDGDPEQIRQLTRAQAEKYYEAYYSPNNATLVLVGDFEPTAARQLVMKYFGDLPPRPPSPQRDLPPATEMSSRVLIDYREPLGKTPLLVLSWLTPAVATADDTVADFVSYLLARRKVGRLNRAFENDQDILAIEAHQMSEASHSTFSLQIMTSTPQIFPAVLAKVDSVLNEIGEHGVSPEEIEKIIRWERNRIFEKMYSLSGKSDLIQSMYASLGKDVYGKQPLHRFDLIDSSDVQKFVKVYLNPRSLVHYVSPTMPLPAAGR